MSALKRLSAMTALASMAGGSILPSLPGTGLVARRATRCIAVDQGLTLVHFSAQFERFYGIGGARDGCVARVKGVLGGF